MVSRSMVSMDMIVIWFTMNLWAVATLIVQGQARVVSASTATVFLMILLLIIYRDYVRIKEGMDR